MRPQLGSTVARVNHGRLDPWKQKVLSGKKELHITCQPEGVGPGRAGIGSKFDFQSCRDSMALWTEGAFPVVWFVSVSVFHTCVSELYTETRVGVASIP